MGATKRYFKTQFQFHMFALEHENVSDFYESSFLKHRTTLLLLCIRTLIFLGCIAKILSSAILTTSIMSFGYWLIFLTHWGIILNAITSGFGVAVSARAYFKGAVEANFGLPWYVKTYWAFCNIAATLSLFITIFYWLFLIPFTEEIDYAISMTLDIFIHAVNSVFMMILLLTGKQPMRLLHCYLPLLLGTVYLLFSVVYYYAGGTNPLSGGPYIYPPLNWSSPGLAFITMVGSIILIIIVHVLVTLLCIARDALSRSCMKVTKYRITT